MGNTRRLPPWMLSGESAAESATNTRKEAKLKTESESPKVNVEKRPRRIVKSKEREDSDESNKKLKNKRRREEEVDDDLTVDDLLSFAHEYVKSEEEEERRKERESLSISEESMVVVVDESNIMRLSNSQGEETNGSRRDSTANDDIMLGLLLGPFFNKPSSTIK